MTDTAALNGAGASSEDNSNVHSYDITDDDAIVITIAGGEAVIDQQSDDADDDVNTTAGVAGSDIVSEADTTLGVAGSDVDSIVDISSPSGRGGSVVLTTEVVCRGRNDLRVSDGIKDIHPRYEICRVAHMHYEVYDRFTLVIIQGEKLLHRYPPIEYFNDYYFDEYMGRYYSTGAFKVKLHEWSPRGFWAEDSKMPALEDGEVTIRSLTRWLTRMHVRPTPYLSEVRRVEISSRSRYILNFFQECGNLFAEDRAARRNLSAHENACLGPALAMSLKKVDPSFAVPRRSDPKLSLLPELYFKFLDMLDLMNRVLPRADMFIHLPDDTFEEI